MELDINEIQKILPHRPPMLLVDRIIAQLLARECSVDEMLVVTFTNAAATEMRERIDKALQKKLLETDDRETCLLYTSPSPRDTR